MKCLLRNDCKDRDLCCSFCPVEGCEMRCKDDHAKCKFFEESPLVNPEKEERPAGYVFSKVFYEEVNKPQKKTTPKLPQKRQERRKKK